MTNVRVCVSREAHEIEEGEDEEGDSMQRGKVGRSDQNLFGVVRKQTEEQRRWEKEAERGRERERRREGGRRREGREGSEEGQKTVKTRRQENR